MKFSTILALSTLSSVSAFAPLRTSSASTQLASSSGPITSAGVTSKTADWNINEISPIVNIQGNTRHTWNMADIAKEMVQVKVVSNGRPVNSDIQVSVTNRLELTVTIHYIIYVHMTYGI